jgi:hypothetical protein
MLLSVDAEVVVQHLTVTSSPPVLLTDREVDGVLGAPARTFATRARVLTTAFSPVASVLGAAAVALAVPLLVVLLPLALMYRLLLELTGWPKWLRADLRGKTNEFSLERVAAP